MKRLFKTLLLLSMLCASFFSVAHFAQAQLLPEVIGDSQAQQDAFGDTFNVQDGLEEEVLPRVVGRVVQFFIGFVGVVLLVVIVYAGVTWLTAGGDSGKIQTAKNYLRNSAIGLVLVLASYMITGFITSQIDQVFFPDSSNSSTQTTTAP